MDQVRHKMGQFMSDDIFDYILVNKESPPQELIDVYAEEGSLVENDIDEQRVIAAPLLGPLKDPQKKDLIKRNLIRHDPEKLAKELMKIVPHL